MWKFLIIFFGLILIYSYENQRFQHAWYDCIEKQMSDRELVRRDVCLEDRKLFKNSVDCEGAERRLRISVPMCTLYTWSVESSIAQIYYRLTGSYWSLFGIILPLLIAYMYFWNQRKMQTGMMEKFGELFVKTKKLKKSGKRDFGNQLSYK